MLGIICFPILWTSAQSLGSDVDFQLSQVSVATYCRCGGNLCGVHEEFSCESIGERIFENRSTFAKVIVKHLVVNFFETQCIYKVPT